MNVITAAVRNVFIEKVNNWLESENIFYGLCGVGIIVGAVAVITLLYAFKYSTVTTTDDNGVVIHKSMPSHKRDAIYSIAIEIVFALSLSLTLADTNRIFLSDFAAWLVLIIIVEFIVRVRISTYVHTEKKLTKEVDKTEINGVSDEEKKI